MSPSSVVKPVLGFAKEAFAFAKRSVKVFMDGDAPSLGASIAYYTVFSIGPLLLIVISIAGFFFGEEAASGKVFAELRGVIGAKGAEGVEEIIKNADRPEVGAIASIAGLVMFAFAATGAFAEIKRALNHLWKAEHEARPGIFGFLRDRMLSFSMVIVIGFLMMVSLIGSSLITMVSDRLLANDSLAVLAELMNIGLSFIIFTVLSACIFKLLPDTKIPWRDVWVGAAVTTVLFIVGRTALAAYIGRSAGMDAYGAASSLALLLLWTYYCAQIFLFGAAITFVFAERHGSRSTVAAGDANSARAPAPVSRSAPIAASKLWSLRGRNGGRSRT